MKTKASHEPFQSESVTKKTQSDYNLSERSQKFNKHKEQSDFKNAHGDVNENHGKNDFDDVSRKQSWSNFERFKSLEKSAASQKHSVKEFDKNSKVSGSNKSRVNSKGNNRYAAEEPSTSKGNFDHENNNEHNIGEYSNNEFSRLSEPKKPSENGSKKNANNNEGENYNENYAEFAMEARRESASNSRFLVNENENKDESQI